MIARDAVRIETREEHFGRSIEHEQSPICRLSGRGRVGNSADRKTVVHLVQGGGRDLRDDADADANAMRTCALSVSRDVPSIAVSLSLSPPFESERRFVRLHLQVQGEVAVVHQSRGRAACSGKHINQYENSQCHSRKRGTEGGREE